MFANCGPKIAEMGPDEICSSSVRERVFELAGGKVWPVEITGAIGGCVFAAGFVATGADCLITGIAAGGGGGGGGAMIGAAGAKAVAVGAPPAATAAYARSDISRNCRLCSLAISRKRWCCSVSVCACSSNSDLVRDGIRVVGGAGNSNGGACAGKTNRRDTDSCFGLGGWRGVNFTPAANN